MKTFFKKHIVSIMTIIILVAGVLWVGVSDSITAGKTADFSGVHTCSSVLSGIHVYDKIMGIVFGIGEMYILVCCWRMELKNEKLKDEIRILRGKQEKSSNKSNKGQ